MGDNMKRWTLGLIGGSGFIGSALSRTLSEIFRVKILDIVPPRFRIENNNLVYERCDIRNYQNVLKCLSDVDLVIHTAIVQIPLINEQKKLGYEVNFIGTQNVCKAVEELSHIKGMILTSSWHTMGERGLSGVVNEEFGFRPDKVEDRARLYALSKIGQEVIVRFYDEMSEKIYGIIRMGTVLGEDMPEKTAANIFIERGLRGESLTPYKHSMYRPMLYVDVSNICEAFKKFSLKILNDEVRKRGNSLDHIVNVYYPKPITILELAEIIQKTIMKYTNNNIRPKIEIIDTGQKPLFDKDDKDKIKVDITRAISFLGLTKLKSPEESIERIVKNRIRKLPKK